MVFCAYAKPKSRFEAREGILKTAGPRWTSRFSGVNEC